MIPDSTIARVRESVNLVDLIREHVPGLKKSGRNFLARCPFHQEKTPSFNVNPEMGVFKCFGCGKGGDAFKFLMLLEGLTYPESIKKLAARVGVEIEEQRSEALSAEAKHKQALYELMEEAARFYHRYLLESTEAAPAREYLRQRGLSDESIARFSIGFAAASGNALRDGATKKGIPVDVLIDAGLVKRKEGSGRLYDHFWNRIVFPIWDTQGRVIAFGGRAMGDAMPKYINSPETPIYSKSRHLYGLFQALPSLRKQRRLVILEGYMDVVVCHQYGFDTTAATLGTALTDDHVRLLRRYADQITLLFDPDNAGAQATLRGGELLVEEGIAADVVTLPDALDPDEILVRDGKDGLEKELAKSIPFMDYLLAHLVGKHPGSSPQSKLAIAKDILPVIRKMRDPLLQDEHLARLADALRVEKRALAAQMKRTPAPDMATGPGAGLAPASRSPNLLSIEEEMLLLALLYPSQGVARRLDDLEWEDARCQQAWPALRPQVASGTIQLSGTLSELTDEVREWLTPLALQQRHYPHPDSTLEELISAWHRRQETAVLRQLKNEIDSMIEGRIPIDSEKVQTYNELSRRLKGSKPTAA